MGTMAGILAKESSFGKDVILQCIANGYRDKLGLPTVDPMELKQEMRKLYPHFMHSPAEIEEEWVKIAMADDEISTVAMAVKLHLDNLVHLLRIIVLELMLGWPRSGMEMA